MAYLTPDDFWLWNYLKLHMYSDGPKSLVRLKDAIHYHASGIPFELLFNAAQGPICHLTAVLIRDGHHIEKFYHLDSNYFF